MSVPPKPPRIRKINSLPMEDTPTGSTPPSVVPSISHQLSTPNDTSSNSKPAIGSSLQAAAHITKALKFMEEKEKTKPAKGTKRDQEYLVIEKDMSSRAVRAVSLYEASPTHDITFNLHNNSTKKMPILPPKIKPVSQSSMNNGAPKRPLLPPNLQAKTPIKKTPVNRRSLSCESTPVHILTQPASRDNHVITSDSSTPPEDMDSSNEDTNVFLSTDNITQTAIPISPSSVSSGIMEDYDMNTTPSPNSRQTTPSCIVYSENLTDERIDRGGVSASQDETDGGNHKQVKPVRPPPPSRGHNQPKLKLKDDNWWIQKQKELPSPTVKQKDTPFDTKSTPDAHVPYRSHAILNSSEKRQSVLPDELLKDKSKPLIGPAGEYYPPAIRSITPEPPPPPPPIEEEQPEEFSVPAVPKRFGKNRRSSSFSGMQDKKIRPVSMMAYALQSRNQELTSASAVVGENQKKVLTAQRHSVKVATPKKNVLGIFRKNKTSLDTTEVLKEDEPPVSGGDSSEDETGGTIKRMPKGTYYQRSLERASSAGPDDDNYIPEYHQLFEYVFVMELKENRSTKKLQAEITYRFPPASDGRSQDVAIQSLEQFCFPDIEQWKPVLSYTSESYSFVLTDMEGKRRFGYCRRLLPNGKGPRLPEVFCIVSPLGCFDLYAKILDIVEQRRTVNLVSVYSFLKSIIANPFPAPGHSVTIQALPAKSGDLETIKLKRSHDSRLEHVDFAELYNALGPKKLIKVFSSLLMERRVILAANKLSTLSSCSHALLALLYPFEWQHTFIPVLPSSLIEFCASPLPYIIGINPSMIKQLDHLELELEEALVVDLDKRKFVKKFGDESSILPSKLSEYLTHLLDATIIRSEYSRQDRRGKCKADDIIVNSFMVVFAYLFGEYKQHMKLIDSHSGMCQLQKQKFVQSFSSKSTQRFLNAFMLTQMFDKFIEEREDPVKLTAVTQGLFEKKLPELKVKTNEIQLFSKRKRFPWQRRK